MNIFQGMYSLDFVTFNGTLHLEEFHLWNFLLELWFKIKL